MGATIVRQWLVLSMLPAPPRRIGTASIEAALRARGVEVHRRTIQRDLMELSEVFPIVVDDRGKPYGWRWATAPTLAGDTRHPLPQPTPRLLVTLRAPRASLDVLLATVGVANARIASDAKDARLAVAEASLEDSSAMRRILLAHADEIEVMSPPELRSEILERLRRGVAVHETPRACR